MKCNFSSGKTTLCVLFAAVSLSSCVTSVPEGESFVSYGSGLSAQNIREIREYLVRDLSFIRDPAVTLLAVSDQQLAESLQHKGYSVCRSSKCDSSFEKISFSLLRMPEDPLFLAVLDGERERLQRPFKAEINADGKSSKLNLAGPLSVLLIKEDRQKTASDDAGFQDVFTAVIAKPAGEYRERSDIFTEMRAFAQEEDSNSLRADGMYRAERKGVQLKRSAARAVPVASFKETDRAGLSSDALPQAGSHFYDLAPALSGSKGEFSPTAFNLYKEEQRRYSENNTGCSDMRCAAAGGSGLKRHSVSSGAGITSSLLTSLPDFLNNFLLSKDRHGI